MDGCKVNRKIIVDDWFNYPPNIEKYEKVGINYYVVKDSKEFTKIEKELIKCPFFILSNESSRVIYVRTLSYVNNDNNYEFYKYENNLLVSNIALTKQTKMKRFILALDYTNEIEVLYVTYGAIQ
jgi:hypothetical protein